MGHNAKSFADPLEPLSQRLQRPASSLRALAGLSTEEIATLCRALDQALAARRDALQRALMRLLPWPLHRVLLPWLRR